MNYLAGNRILSITEKDGILTAEWMDVANETQDNKFSHISDMLDGL